MIRKEITCESCADGRLSAYIDGQLDGVALRDVNRHLAECTSCRSEVEKLEKTKSLLQHMRTPLVPTSETFWADTYRLARTSRPVVGDSVRASLSFQRRVGLLAGVAGAVVALLFAVANSGPVDNGYAVGPVAPANDTVDVSSLVSAHANYIAGRRLVDGSNNRIIRSDLAAQTTGETSLAPTEAFSVDPVSDATSD